MRRVTSIYYFSEIDSGDFINKEWINVYEIFNIDGVREFQSNVRPLQNKEPVANFQWTRLLSGPEPALARQL